MMAHINHLSKTNNIRDSLAPFVKTQDNFVVVCPEYKRTTLFKKHRLNTKNIHPKNK
jgi:hypothetical protein